MTHIHDTAEFAARVTARRSMSIIEMVDFLELEEVSRDTYLYIDTEGRLSAVEKSDRLSSPDDEFESVGYISASNMVGDVRRHIAQRGQQAAHAAHMLATIEPSEAELSDAQEAEETEFQSVLEYVAEQHGLSAEALERAILVGSAFTREEWVSGIAHRALAKPLSITFRQVMENIASDEAAQ